MLADDALGTDFSGLGKGNVFFRPGGADHARPVVIHLAGSAVDQVAHAIHQPYLGGNGILQGKFHRFVGYEIRLHGHNAPPCTGLRHLIHDTFLFIRVFHIRQHHHIQKFFDERTFACAYRAYYANVDFAPGALCNIVIEIKLFHPLLSSHPHMYHNICTKTDRQNMAFPEMDQIFCFFPI